MRAGTALVLLLLLLLGCEGPPPPPDAGARDAGVDAGGPGIAPCSRDAGPRDSGSAGGRTGACARALLLSGFGLRLGEGARPISRWGVQVRPLFPDTCPPGADLRGATLTSTLDRRVERATVRVSHHVVGAGGAAPPADAGAGWAGPRVRRGSATVDLEGGEDERREPVLFDLALAGLEGAPAIAVVLDGLELETDLPQDPRYPVGYDPADGYALRSVGASVGGVVREGSDLRFEVTGRFAVGRLGDPEMDLAASLARRRMIVHFAVVGLPAEAPTAAVSYRQTHAAHGAEPLAVCRPDPALTALEIEGPPAMSAAPGLVSFRIDLLPDEEGAGALLHELSVLVDAFEHDRASGLATMRVEGYASNQGPPAPGHAMDFAFRAEVALLSWAGPSESVALRFEHEVGGGRTDLPLPLAP